MKAILVVALATSQASFYKAKVSTFGCTSIEAVSQLERIRSDESAFRAALLEKQIYGQCVAILKGTLVKGSIEDTKKSILRVNQEIQPPGYEAPSKDFENEAMFEKSRIISPYQAAEERKGYMPSER